ncbi:MAG: signal peptidase I [Kiritimatiellia bacterium]
MNYFQKRKLRKLVKHYLYEARHLKHMREDILEPSVLAELEAARQALMDTEGQGDPEKTEKALSALCEIIDKACPDYSFPKARENVEILVVAFAVAMAFRTYFIQPFKIPTGSMQPTLYGITMHPAGKANLLDKQPLRLAKFLVTGHSHVTIRAPVSGKLRFLGTARSGEILLGIDKNGRPKIKRLDTSYDADIFNIENTTLQFPISVDFTMHVTSGDVVERGQIIATGKIRAGDHIFVNRVKYNFTRPSRGDVFVFDTSHIDHPEIRGGTFYIKRLAGMPGESISIQPPYLVADGRRIEEPYGFKRLLTEPEKGYKGYHLAQQSPGRVRPYLVTETDELCLKDDEYLPFGDNTDFSLDGRFFGPVKERDIIGPAFTVYWPPTKRLGRIQ